MRRWAYPVTRRSALALGGGLVGTVAAATLSASPGQAAALPGQETSVPQAGTMDWTPVAQALGKKGQMMPGGVYRITMPRTDLTVRVKGVLVAPGFALGSYAAFMQIGSMAMGMGDLVLLDAEVNPVMSGLLAGGLTLGALHNHLNEVAPHVMYMHYSGRGDAVQMATALRTALSASGTPLGSAAAKSTAAATPLDTKGIAHVLGHPAKVMPAGIVAISAPRGEKITESGMTLPPAIGVATSLNFQPLGVSKAAITGDFVLIGREVNPVARALRQHGIEVTALHNHALADDPRLFYMHFFATGDVMTLARGLRAGLDQTNSMKPQPLAM